MKKAKIKKIKAREILDSRGNPTVEVDLITEQGLFRASVPSGVSKGKYEAVELRDGGKRYQGRSVLKAMKNVNEIIYPRLKGKDPRKQKEIDNLMIELDGTENKSKLGGNSILPVSIAVCRAGAAANNIPLYKYISHQIEDGSLTSSLKIPKPCFNIINGGTHAGNELDFQEFMIVPQENSFSENLRVGTEVYHQLKKILAKQFGTQAINSGDEGGFAPPIKFPEQVIEFILMATKDLNYRNKIKIILDIASSQFFEKGKYKMRNGVFTKEGLMRYYEELISDYPILGLEDPFSEDDWEGWQSIMSNVKAQMSKLMVIGDDLLATNPKRIKLAQEKKACNTAIIKMNQIGTITETLEAVKLAKEFGWKVIISHRSGETADSFISDLAVGTGADFIKSGAPARGERVAKYNQLLRIEEELK